MTSTIHYRLKSTPNFDTVEFDGINITLLDLKNLLSNKSELLLKSGLFDIIVEDEKTLIKYVAENDLIPSESHVTICRIPAKRKLQKLSSAEPNVKRTPVLNTELDTTENVGLKNTEEIIGREILENANKDFLEECEKIRSFSQDPEYLNYYGKPLPTGKIPPNYICHRCGLPGHWIQNCPTIKIGTDGRPLRSENPIVSQVKRSYGIPSSFLQPASGPNQLGAVLTRDGSYAVPTIDAEAYQRGKKEKPPFLENSKNTEKRPEAEPIPQDLSCPLCSKLIDDAVVLPCCHEPVCDKCITDSLLSTDKHQCPLCSQTGVAPCQLLPNNFLRKKVKEYNSMTAKRHYLELISTNRPQDENSPNKLKIDTKKTGPLTTREGAEVCTGISKEAVDSLISRDPSLSLPTAPMIPMQMNPMLYFQQQVAAMQMMSYYPQMTYLMQPPIQNKPKLLTREEFYAVKHAMTKAADTSAPKDPPKEAERPHKKRRSTSRRHRSKSRERDTISKRSSHRTSSRNQLDKPASKDSHSSRRHRKRSFSRSPARRHKHRRRRSSD